MIHTLSKTGCRLSVIRPSQCWWSTVAATPLQVSNHQLWQTLIQRLEILTHQSPISNLHPVMDHPNICQYSAKVHIPHSSSVPFYTFFPSYTDLNGDGDPFLPLVNVSSPLTCISWREGEGECAVCVLKIQHFSQLPNPNVLKNPNQNLETVKIWAFLCKKSIFNGLKTTPFIHISSLWISKSVLSSSSWLFYSLCTSYRLFLLIISYGSVSDLKFLWMGDH